MGDTDLTILQQLWEFEAIKRVQARYCRLVDLRDWEGVIALFSPDCRFTHPVHSDVTGPRDFFARVAARITPGVSVHQVHAPEISLTSATTATGIWALFDYVETEDRTIGYQGYGFYEEEFAKTTSGEWVITSFHQRRLRMDAVAHADPWRQGLTGGM